MPELRVVMDERLNRLLDEVALPVLLIRSAENGMPELPDPS